MLTKPAGPTAAPHAPDAERSVLAAILNHPGTAPSLLGVVAPDMFWTHNVKSAMSVVADLVAEGVPPEPATVHTRLGGEGFDLADLMSLQIDAPSDGGALECARVVARHATDRAALAQSHELRAAVESGRLTESLPGILDRLATLRPSSGPEATTWEPVDLTVAVSGGDLEIPAILQRTDGKVMLYAGRIHSFQGESESCKSWAALMAVVEVIASGGRVLFVDFEDDEAGVTARLKALGVPTDQILERFVYVRPDEPLHNRHGQPTAASVALDALISANRFGLCVIDGVTEAMVTEGLDLLSNSDVAAWMRRLPRKIAATGSAVIVVDHVTKNRETQGRYAIGGQHKLAGLTGAAYVFQTLRPFSRAGSEPVEGAIAITVVKDRPGYVRAWATEGKVGTLELTSWPDNTVSAAIVPPSSQLPADMIIVNRVLNYLGTYDGASKNQIEHGVEGKADKIRDALAWMVAPPQAWVRVEAKGRSHLHWLTPDGRAQLDQDDDR